MAARAETPAPAWQRGRVASWLVTTDHKRIGILYIATSIVFLVLAGLMALVMRLQLAHVLDNCIERLLADLLDPADDGTPDDDAIDMLTEQADVFRLADTETDTKGQLGVFAQGDEQVADLSRAVDE